MNMHEDYKSWHQEWSNLRDLRLTGIRGKFADKNYFSFSNN